MITVSSRRNSAENSPRSRGSGLVAGGILLGMLPARPDVYYVWHQRAAARRRGRVIEGDRVTSPQSRPTRPVRGRPSRDLPQRHRAYRRPGRRGDRERRRAGRRPADRGRRPVAGGAGRRRGGRCRGRHPDAGHGGHPPAHVADRAAGPGRELVADQLFPLLLRQLGPRHAARGRARRQPAVGDRVGRRGRDHHGGLVARAAHGGLRRGRGGRAGGGAGPVHARLRQPVPGAVGVGGQPRVPRVRGAAAGGRERPAGLDDGVRHHRRPGVPRGRRVRGGPRAGLPGDHAHRCLGRDRRRQHPL